MNWLDKSKSLLQEACTPWGIKASLTTKDNYGAIFTRDAVMAGIVGLLLDDDIIIKGLVDTLLQLKNLQGPQGQIASNFRVENGQVSKISFGTLSPKIDSCTWYLIGVGLLVKEGYVDKDEFRKSVELSINLLEGIEYNGKNLLYVPKGGNWADEYIYEGYILYDQILRVWGLSLLATVYGDTVWYDKSKAIKETISQSYKEEHSEFYISSFYPGGKFKKFDLAAHAIAGIVLDKNNDFFKNALKWISEKFIKQGKLPPVFYPVIDEGDPGWDQLSNYHLFRFKNMPHHFHNGGVWWIWLGWLAVSLSLWHENKALEKLIDIAINFLNENRAQFDFDEYISPNDHQLNGTKKLVYTASGISFLSLAKNGFNFSKLIPSASPSINEPFEIKKEYFDLTSQLIERIQESSLLETDKFVIGVAGESGSGKSVTAKCLQIELEKLNIPSVVIHQDSYYKLPPKENHEKRKADIGWVGTNEIRLDLMQEHVDKFKSHADVIATPNVNYKKNNFFQVDTIIKDVKVLIVEGVYTFFLENLDYKIFMSRTYKETIESRKSRSREVYDPFVEQVLAIEHFLVSPFKSLANVIIKNDYSLEDSLKIKK